MSVFKILKSLGLYRAAQGIRDSRLKGTRLAFYSMIIKPGALCFDIGANIGNRTDIFLKLGAKVVAIEPQIEPFQYLIKRFGKNSNFVAINKALGTEQGFAEMFLCFADGSSSMSQDWITKVKQAGRFPRGYSWNHKVTVPVTTMDSLISAYGLPKFCKIDVEGYEFEVIQGMTTPIPMISFECTSEVIHTSLSVIDYLTKLDRYEFNFVRGESTQFCLSEWQSYKSILKFLNQFKQSKEFGDVYARLTT